MTAEQPEVAAAAYLNAAPTTIVIIGAGLGGMAVLRGDEPVRRADGRAADAEGLHQALARKRSGALGCGNRIGTLSGPEVKWVSKPLSDILKVGDVVYVAPVAGIARREGAAAGRRSGHQGGQRFSRACGA